VTHTYALLPVSKEAFDEVATHLRAAGYDHAFVDDGIDMHGIALSPEPVTVINLLSRMEKSFLGACDAVAKEHPYVGRELAVAKTQMQTAMLWAHDALKKTSIDRTGIGA
jgi:hypothetical protein